jgi:hypothetical protein
LQSQSNTEINAELTRKDPVEFKCDYCSNRYKENKALNKHLKTCEIRVQSHIDSVKDDTCIVDLKSRLNETIVENRFLKEQLKKQEDRSKEHIDRLNDQIFKLASRSTTNTTNITQINNYLISSLSPLDLEPNRIQKIIDENYTPERFKQQVQTNDTCN